MKSSIQNCFQVAVIGAGPSGIASVGTLLSNKITKILWIDPFFQGGRLPLYTKVPSNTKVRIFQDFVNECPIFKEFCCLPDKLEDPLSHYQGLDPEKECSLGIALENLRTLTKNIRKYHSSEVFSHESIVRNLELDTEKRVWTIQTKNQDHSVNEFFAKSVILASGSKPKYFPVERDFSTLFGVKNPIANNLYLPEMIDLDTSINPELLQQRIKENDVVAVVGSSHSSMVVIKNLVELRESPKKIMCFYIEELKFAEYLPEGWILYDNTGLKGDVAAWVRQELLQGKVPKVEMVFIDKEQKVLKEKIPLCNKIIYTIGFQRNSLPLVSIRNKGKREIIEEKSIDYDNQTAELLGFHGGKKIIIDGLYGCGIAWPEKTTDPRGNVEFAVGFKKFMSYANKFIPDSVIKRLQIVD